MPVGRCFELLLPGHRYSRALRRGRVCGCLTGDQRTGSPAQVAPAYLQECPSTTAMDQSFPSARVSPFTPKTEIRLRSSCAQQDSASLLHERAKKRWFTHSRLHR